MEPKEYQHIFIMAKEICGSIDSIQLELETIEAHIQNINKNA